jgi:hypothetical protein
MKYGKLWKMTNGKMALFPAPGPTAGVACDEQQVSWLPA